MLWSKTDKTFLLKYRDSELNTKHIFSINDLVAIDANFGQSLMF